MQSLHQSMKKSLISFSEMFESVDQIVNLVETDPCASAVSLVTLINLLGYYPVPIRLIFKMIFQYDWLISALTSYAFENHI